MNPESIYFFLMLGSFVALAAIKVPISVSLMFSALVGALASGHFFPVRHLVEGGFGYFDAILVIATAMIFMESIRFSGLLEDMARRLTRTFHRRPLFLLMVMTFFIMIAGMITGSSSAAVLTTGAIAFPVLTDLGFRKPRAGALIAMASIFGMIAPPINIPAMIIGQGVDMPYIGFTAPLLLLTFPLAIATALLLGFRVVKPVDVSKLPSLPPWKKAWVMYVPLLLLVVGMVLENSRFSLSLGLPLIFLACAIVASFSGKKSSFWKVSLRALKESIGILSILVGVGMFIQVMTLNGTRGLIVSFLNDLPSGLALLGIAVGVPLFGAVSSYGAASVLGVPFLLAFLGQNDIMVCSALALLAGLGDMVPPTALAGIFAAHVVGEKNYFTVWWRSMPSFFLTMVFATLALVFSRGFGDVAGSPLFLPLFLGALVVLGLLLIWVDGVRQRRWAK